MKTDHSPRNGIDSSQDRHPVPEIVDWLAAVVIALGGMVLIVGGSALTFLIDRNMLEGSVESGQIQIVILVRELTEVEMLKVTLEVVAWTGIGLLITGIGLVLFAIGYAIASYRSYQLAEKDEPAGFYRSAVVLGAVVTAILSFLPFSPLLGGGTAGYLEHSWSGRSTSVGAFSGFLGMLPVLVILVFVTVGIYAGFAAINDPDYGIVTTAVMLFTLVFVGGYGTGLGALGGFIGGRLAKQ